MRPAEVNEANCILLGGGERESIKLPKKITQTRQNASWKALPVTERDVAISSSCKKKEEIK